jgi:tetratricopeptide (TPR) repeat protein
MMNTQLGITLERYEAALKNLEGTGKTIEVEQLLTILNARDAVQIALKEQKSIPTSWLKKVIELDAALREKAELIIKAVNGKTAKQLVHWRESLQPTTEAWWWRLESIAPHPWDTWDWFWKFLSVAGWTANLSLLVNIATRFLGGGVGLGGAAAVMLPSILALIQASSELTKAGHEGFEKSLEKLRIPKQFQQEAKLGSTLLMSLFLLCFWFALPSFSHLYNRNGLRNYQSGDLGTAEQDYLRAISLNADNAEAHFNLGDLYEDWQEWDKAKKEYQIAVAGGLPEAYNNLAHLYIQDKKYPQAAALLANGLDSANKKNSNSEVRYSLLKNLGWVRLEQGRYEEAQQTLQAAIGIANKPEVAKYVFSRGAAHCLLAQILEKQKQSTALEQWQKCSQLGSRLNPDEDTWLHLAQKKLRKVGK